MKFRSKRLVVLGAVIATAAAVAVPVALSVTVNGFLSYTDPKQQDRLVRDGFPSGCHLKANPGLIGDGHQRPYDKYGFTNTASTTKCVQVRLEHLCDPFNAFASASSAFVPSDPSAHYLGDAGDSGSPQNFSVPVGAGRHFDVVVAEVDGGPHALPCRYRLTVSIPGQLSFTTGATG